ncbi:maleate cis-trans isomerase family protein [Streptomyces sp. NPDC001985]|uniref:maleate cis-trans isomerase family protein n=1 Tax=Streptomyces sp. NPDC001985 TaxID=3154406 RepID=UPI0033327FAD
MLSTGGGPGPATGAAGPGPGPGAGPAEAVLPPRIDERRARLAVLVPSTNTVVEGEYAAMAPRGVTLHTGRMLVPAPSVASDDDTTRLLGDVREGVPGALRSVMTCRPDRVLLGMSAPTFYGGLAGAGAYEAEIAARAGVPATAGSTACTLALRALGARRISVLSPYRPVNDREVRNYFTEAGFAIAGYHTLLCTSAHQIAEVGEEVLVRAVDRLARARPDAIVQVGTNLWFAALAVSLERRLDIPVVAINTATLWAGLRATGINDRFTGAGRLLADH